MSFFIPHHQRKESLELTKRMLLIFDGYKSHVTLKVFLKAKDNGVDMVSLPLMNYNFWIFLASSYSNSLLKHTKTFDQEAILISSKARTLKIQVLFVGQLEKIESTLSL